eukprot:g6188.t1 g6188   contig20:1032949-1034593(+)
MCRSERGSNATLLSALGSGSETLRITKQLASELNKHVQSGSISDSVSGWFACVGSLVSSHDKPWNGFRVKSSTMKDMPSPLLRSFSGSLQRVLPASPTATYSTNAVVFKHTEVSGEAYYPGCTPWWNAITKEYGRFLSADSEFAKRSDSADPRALREDVIQTCSDNDDKQCPFEKFGIVINLMQAYCGETFHWYIEIWPRIAPFLPSLLADDAPSIAIHIGCKVQGYHRDFFELAGLNSSKVALIDEVPVFAKEVIIPTSGYSHSPLLNYWNLVSMREHVEQRIRVSTPVKLKERRKVLILVRDKPGGRRADSNYFSEQFLNDLSTGLNSTHDVETFRSSNDELMSCLLCQVRAIQSADVIIGSHGAGLSHLLFAKDKATVLERMTSDGDSGIYAELAFLVGSKYFPVAKNAKAKVYSDLIRFAESN